MKEILQRIKDIEREQIRRESQPLCLYNKTKVHKKQMEFHKCLKRNRWVFGGNRTGKTECGAVETVWLARGIHPYRKNKPDICCWVVSLSQQVQRDVAQQKVLYYLDKSWIKDVVMVSGSKSGMENGVIDYIVVANVFGGTSRIAFKSCEAGREKFQGTSLDFVWFDEEPPHDIYRECAMRVIDREGHLFGTMTPLKRATWVYDEIYLNCHNDSEVWCEFMEWADNPFLSTKEIQQLSATLSKEELESRRYGRFMTDACGIVYTEFCEANVVTPFNVPEDWQMCLSVDPGLNNPLSCHWYAVDGDGNVFVVAEHYQAKRDVQYHAEKIRAICQELGWHKDSFGRYVMLMDSAANQKTLSGPNSVATLFEEHGFTVNTHVNKDVCYGISKVKNLLYSADGVRKLFIFSCCVNLIREMKGYKWGEGDNPVKKDDHALDELRYFVCSLPSAEDKVQKSWVQQDKERLFRLQHRRIL